MTSIRNLDYGSVAARELIEEQCRTFDPSTNLISAQNTVNLVIRFTKEIAVKFGIGVVHAEACALQFAHDHLDPALVKVPKLIQFFTAQTNKSWTIGYIVMELVSGTPLDEIEDVECASMTLRLTRIIDHMHTLTDPRPGPLGGGHARGLLWSEYSSGQDFKSTKDLQAYLQSRFDVVDGPGSIDVTKSRLCFCHMDISPRNILLDGDGSVALLDWGCAGFYPSIFEIWSVQLETHMRPNPTWQLLSSTIETRLGKEDRLGLAALSQVYRANQSFMFPNIQAEAETQMLMQAACSSDGSPERLTY